MKIDETEIKNRQRKLSDSELKEIGKRIRKRRVKQGWSIYQLAERSNLSYNHLDKIENGKGSFTLAVLKDVARALGASYDYIVEGKLRSEDIVPEDTLELLERCSDSDYRFINRVIIAVLELKNMDDGDKKY